MLSNKVTQVLHRTRTTLSYLISHVREIYSSFLQFRANALCSYASFESRIAYNNFTCRTCNNHSISAAMIMQGQSALVTILHNRRRTIKDKWNIFHWFNLYIVLTSSDEVGSKNTDTCATSISFTDYIFYL